MSDVNPERLPRARLRGTIRSADVQLTVIKDGRHRLSPRHSEL